MRRGGLPGIMIAGGGIDMFYLEEEGQLFCKLHIS
jgi:hypothetical protein